MFKKYQGTKTSDFFTSNVDFNPPLPTGNGIVYLSTKSRFMGRAVQIFLCRFWKNY